MTGTSLKHIIIHIVNPIFDLSMKLLNGKEDQRSHMY